MRTASDCFWRNQNKAQHPCTMKQSLMELTFQRQFESGGGGSGVCVFGDGNYSTCV